MSVATIAFASTFNVPTIRLNGYDVNYSGDRVTKAILKCEVTSDGGASVECFIGEYQEKYGGKWIIKGSQDSKWYNSNKCDYSFTEMMEGKEYSFRVSAINKIGASEPVVLNQLIQF